jgi:lysophospholipase L1-like esterase
MNPVALHLASGMSVFSGVGLLLLAVLLSPWCRNPWAKRGRTLLAWLGLLLIITSATPWPLWIELVGIVVFAWWFLAEEVDRVRRLCTSFLPRFALVAVGILLVGLEYPYTLRPEIPSRTGQPLYVIGDSISAGIRGPSPPWPSILATKYGVSVTNLSVAGATVGDASWQAAKIKEARGTVLIEIGGNDLLAGLPAREFRRSLESLLASLQQPGRTLVMLELPLIPFFSGYGRAQRELAKQFHVYLIPKRDFTNVLGSPGATEDGLHLSKLGALRMAETIYSILGPVLSASAPPLP